MIAALIRTVFAQPDADTARAQLRAVVDQLAPCAPTVAERLQGMENDVLAYTGFPAAHQSKIWSNNPIPVFQSEAPRVSQRRLLGSAIVPESDSNPISTPRYSELSSVRNVDFGAVTGACADLMRASLTLNWDVVAQVPPTPHFHPGGQP